MINHICQGKRISIHSPHTRGDSPLIKRPLILRDFNPLPSYEGRLHVPHGVRRRAYFNPLPSYEGRRKSSRPIVKPTDFNPLPSYEGRLVGGQIQIEPVLFQSTPLIRGETMGFEGIFFGERFQSTPLIRGETVVLPLRGRTRADFNPLPSYEGRPAPCGFPSSRPLISIHSPHTRGDLRRKGRTTHHQHFNPLPSYEGRLRRGAWRQSCHTISIHSPHTRGDRVINKFAETFKISIHSPHTRGDACMSCKSPSD